MNEKFLEKYINSYSPSGLEINSQKLWIEEGVVFADEISVENYGNVIAKKNGKSEKRILLEAHVDEVSYRVNMITSDGFIYLIKNGNADHQIAPSSRVKIHTEKGLVDGVFGWPAIHNRETTKTPTIENIFIDCGVESGKKLIKMGVKIGDLVTFPPNFQILGNYYTGKGLDNKIGGYILSQVLNKIKNVECDLTSYFANVVQEEVGHRGANMLCQNYNPDLAIIIDVTHDTTTPMMNAKKSGNIACGRGPVISLSPTTQINFVKFIEKVATDNKINYQRKALGKSTGTDADDFANRGIVTALVSIPLRYMHTKVEMVHARDVEHTIDLLFHVIKDLKSDFNFSLI